MQRACHRENDGPLHAAGRCAALSLAKIREFPRKLSDIPHRFNGHFPHMCCGKSLRCRKKTQPLCELQAFLASGSGP
jgi:hypothetical protein